MRLKTARGVRVRTRIRAGAGDGGGAGGAGGNGAPPGGGGGSGAPPADQKPAPTAADLAELAALKKFKVDTETAEAARLKAEKDKADAEALKRGEHEQLLVKEKAAREAAERDAADARFGFALSAQIAGQVVDGALGQVVQLFPRAGLKIGADGMLEGLQPALDAFKKASPWFFKPEDPAKAGQGAQGGKGAPPAGPSGLPGSNPAKPSGEKSVAASYLKDRYKRKAAAGASQN